MLATACWHNYFVAEFHINISYHVNTDIRCVKWMDERGVTDNRVLLLRPRVRLPRHSYSTLNGWLPDWLVAVAAYGEIAAEECSIHALIIWRMHCSFIGLGS